MKTVTTHELKTLLEQDEHLTLVNTLGEDSFETTRIPGAVNIPSVRAQRARRHRQQTKARCFHVRNLRLPRTESSLPARGRPGCCR